MYPEKPPVDVQVIRILTRYVVLLASPVIVLGEVHDPLLTAQVEPPFELYSICTVVQLLVVKFTVIELEVELINPIVGVLQQANVWLYPYHSDILAGLDALGLEGLHVFILA